MLPWSFSEQAAAEKYMPQLQHNMWVVNSKGAVLSAQGIPLDATLVADPARGAPSARLAASLADLATRVTHAWAWRQGGVKTG